MLYRFRKQLATNRFNKAVSRVTEIPCVTPKPSSNFVLVSQVYPVDLYMYLVAVRSFTNYLLPKKVIVVADKLEPHHVALLRQNIREIEIRHTHEIDTTGFPLGGCWERLLTILDTAEADYTIQLDADTLTQSYPTEVADCIKANRSFTLGTNQGREITSLSAASKFVKNLADDSHVQILSELKLQELPERIGRYYIRGNAAFAGFSKGWYNRGRLREFSENMEQLLGSEKWREWGSEQVTSNFAIANADIPLILPFEKYRYYHPELRKLSPLFLHFIGPHRFTRGVYKNAAKSLVTSWLT